MSSYNERFQFEDPLGPRSACRVTRYRAKRKSAQVARSTHCDDFPVLPNHDDTEFRDHDYRLEMGLHQTDEENDQQEVQNTDVNEPPEERRDTCGAHMHSSDSSQSEEHETTETLMLTPPIVRENIAEYEEDFLSEGSVPASSNRPLYEGSRLSVAASGVLVQKFAMRHKVTKEALGDLLQLLKIHCPTSNLCISSVHRLKKLFPDLEYKPVFHYFCSECLEEVTDVETCQQCTNPVCQHDLSQLNSVSSFIELPIDQQLKAILERELSRVHNIDVNPYNHVMRGLKWKP